MAYNRRRKHPCGTCIPNIVQPHFYSLQGGSFAIAYGTVEHMLEKICLSIPKGGYTPDYFGGIPWLAHTRRIAIAMSVSAVLLRCQTKLCFTVCWRPALHGAVHFVYLMVFQVGLAFGSFVRTSFSNKHLMRRYLFEKQRTLRTASRCRPFRRLHFSRQRP